jgi:proliferating cell nuclear antigen
MKLSITTKKLKELIAPIYMVADECVLNVNESGISAKVVYHVNIEMIKVEYPAEMFEVFEVENPTKIGLEIALLNRKIRFNEPKAIIEMTTSNTSSPIGIESTMLLDCDGFQDKLCLIDPQSIRKEPKIPEMNLTGKMTIPRTRMIKILNKSNYSKGKKECTYIIFEIKDGKFITETTELHPTKSITELPSITGEAKSLYAADNLLELCKSIKSKTIDIELGKDYPIIIKFDVAETGKAEFLLAPRVES